MSKWIQKAIGGHEGKMTAKANREGVSNAVFEEEHKDEPGVAGKEARLAITLKGLHGVSRK